MTRPSTLSSLIFFCALFLASANQSFQNGSPSMKSPSLINITGPGECRNVKYNQTALAVTVTWSPPIPIISGTFLIGYLLEYRLREFKKWSPMNAESLANYTVAYTFKKNKTTNAFEVLLTPFSFYNSTHLIKGTTTRIYNAASTFLPSVAVTILLAILGDKLREIV